MSYRVNQLLLSLEESLILQILIYQLSCSCTGHATVFLGAVIVKCAVRIKDVDHFQVVPLSYFPVVRVVGRGDLDHTGSEFLVYIGVGDDGDNPVCQRKLELLAYNSLVPLIIWMHCNCSIAQEGLGTGGCNLNPCASVRSRTVCKFIPDVVHCSVCVYVVNFVVGKCCAAPRTPVYKVLAFIDKSPLVQGYKYFPYCL